MAWFGSSEHIEAMANVFLYGLGILLCHALAVPHHHRVPHRELRAFAARRKPAAGISTIPTAPCGDPVAGPELQADVEAAWTGGAANTHGVQPHPRGAADATSEQPQPAPIPMTTVGAGPNHRTVDEPLLEGGPAESPQPPPPTAAAGPSIRSTSTPLGSASTGVEPREREDLEGHEPGVSGPDTGASARQLAAP